MKRGPYLRHEREPRVLERDQRIRTCKRMGLIRGVLEERREGRGGGGAGKGGGV